MDDDVFEVEIRLTPRSSRNRVECQEDGTIKAWVMSAPTDNQANKALCELIAKTIGIAKTNVTISSGHTSRMKRLLIRGITKDVALVKLLS